MELTGERRARASGPTSRVLGLDVARALAVLGMFAAHIGPHPRDGAEGAVVLEVFHGRSAALFALLAGVSLALLSGGRTPAAGGDRGAVVVRLAVRALLLFLIGLVLGALGTPVLVILCYYAVYFALALPLLWLRPAALWAVAAAWAVLGPLVSFWLRSRWAPSDQPYEYHVFESLEWSNPDGLPALLVTGSYPALTWMPFVLAGVAVGRLDLSSTRVARTLSLVGAGLAVAGYGLSVWISASGNADRLRGLLLDQYGLGTPPTEEFASRLDQLVQWGMLGTVPSADPAWLLVSSPHSGTPFEVVGATGVGLLVLGGCLLLCRWGVVAAALTPLRAIGSMPLTVYGAHLVALAAAHPLDEGDRWPALGLFVLITAVVAVGWSLVFRRGPLEWMLWSASTRVSEAVTGSAGAR
ncbi:DUF418 domain-containing protein [Actinoalloteichus caeruleus]|uniref:Membrane protein YeiB n=1 Tax=Actinoalloteichus caeruleus DSM 43889 TaxID=1120930 RepID=A0ABT1JMA7_ACTCY|nr:DUF418 domain-containing protein [Actinoalloteichus caeruleus]MCP2333660.1 putative membrane protein YeiB [Actinoalloteichus caeruleus DSM 43889]